MDFLTRRLSTNDDFGSEVVSGVQAGSAEFFVGVGVGLPPQEQHMVVDTGSDVVWVQCQPCTQCYRSQVDPVYDPPKFSAFGRVQCGSPLCGLFRKTTAGSRTGRDCLCSAVCSDRSHSKSSIVLDSLSFETTTVLRSAIGCGHDSRGLFFSAGGVLLGMGWTGMSFINQIGSSARAFFTHCLAMTTSSTGWIAFRLPAAYGWSCPPAGALALYLYIMWASSALASAGTCCLFPRIYSSSGERERAAGVVMEIGRAVTRLPATAYEALRDAMSRFPRAPSSTLA